MQFDMLASMSPRCNRYDNSPMESSWASLSEEHVHHLVLHLDNGGPVKGATMWLPFRILAWCQR